MSLMVSKYPTLQGRLKAMQGAFMRLLNESDGK